MLCSVKTQLLNYFTGSIGSPTSPTFDISKKEAEGDQKIDDTAELLDSEKGPKGINIVYPVTDI